MKHLFTLIVVIALLNRSYAATKTKCDVVRALRAQGVPDSLLRDCKYNELLEPVFSAGLIKIH